MDFLFIDDQIIPKGPERTEQITKKKVLAFASENIII